MIVCMISVMFRGPKRDDVHAGPPPRLSYRIPAPPEPRHLLAKLLRSVIAIAGIDVSMLGLLPSDVVAEQSLRYRLDRCGLDVATLRATASRRR